MPAPWTADQFLLAMEETLRPLCGGIGGELDTASTPEHALEIMATAPARWRCILLWPGWSDHAESINGMAAQRISLIVQVAKGMAVRQGDVLHKIGTMEHPMMSLIETASAWVRAMRMPEGVGFSHKGFAQVGSAWLEIEGLDTLQHQLDFSIDQALPGHPVLIPVKDPNEPYISDPNPEEPTP